MTKYECIDHVHYGDNLILALFLNKSSKIICEIDNVGILPYPSFQSGQCKDQQQHFLVVAFHLWLFPTNLLIILLFQRDKSHGLKGSTLKELSQKIPFVRGEDLYIHMGDCLLMSDYNLDRFL
ncbi:uncharacterized protein LOC107305091 isoform X1 [Oryza brachyantha]|uniref:uncharacterized protein LOC107305091 isoform X1 n=1 Tax=Oryza brachyantha TaxID=4533 RepID=UPI0007768921|nr:uncharacterized protein LOC107305091 isoform X1 [Oryza brachyantha]XP_015697103.1 uncharacterized protein LOC107305091 isoform X1 [Oryza brachyantha]